MTEEYVAREMEQLLKTIASHVEMILREVYRDVKVEVKDVLKTNGMQKAITAHAKDTEAAPTIYAEEMYRQYEAGIPTEEIAYGVGEQMKKAMKNDIEMPTLTEEEAKKHITLTVVNTEMNQELLRKTPHFPIADGEISAIPRWYITEEASFVVSNEIASRMMMTPDEILRIGQKNVNCQEFESRPMQDILAEMMGVDPEDIMPEGATPMIVVTSQSHIQGSNALLSKKTLDQIHEKYGDVVICPSSLHEIIALPISDEMKPDEIRSVIRGVNQTQVSKEDFLSDQVFKYDGKRLSIVGDTFKPDVPKVEPLKMDKPKMRMSM